MNIHRVLWIALFVEEGKKKIIGRGMKLMRKKSDDREKSSSGHGEVVCPSRTS
jgi:hypothetical protein